MKGKRLGVSERCPGVACPFAKDESESPSVGTEYYFASGSEQRGPHTLEELRALNLPPDTLVLPSHGLPFRGIALRVAQLRAHPGTREIPVVLLPPTASPTSAVAAVRASLAATTLG